MKRPVWTSPGVPTTFRALQQTVSQNGRKFNTHLGLSGAVDGGVQTTAAVPCNPDTSQLPLRCNDVVGTTGRKLSAPSNRCRMAQNIGVQNSTVVGQIESIVQQVMVRWRVGCHDDREHLAQPTSHKTQLLLLLAATIAAVIDVCAMMFSTTVYSTVVLYHRARKPTRIIS